MSSLATPPPPAGLEPTLRPLYEEARAVCDASPAAACALLRLLVRALLLAAGRPGRDLRGDLDVVAGDAPGVFRALDAIGLSAEASRRPGELDLGQGHGDAQNLFVFVNLLVTHLSEGRPPRA